VDSIKPNQIESKDDEKIKDTNRKEIYLDMSKLEKVIKDKKALFDRLKDL
jgi:hypothetical protein